MGGKMIYLGRRSNEARISINHESCTLGRGVDEAGFDSLIEMNYNRYGCLPTGGCETDDSGHLNNWDNVSSNNLLRSLC